MIDKVHPGLKAVFALMPESRISIGIEDARRGFNEMVESNRAPILDSIYVTDRFITEENSDNDLRVRLYEPKQRNELLPGLIWIHGGGYILGNPEMNDYICQRFVSEINCVVVSVDYRLAPEHAFPIPVEDCYKALQWFAENAAALGVDSTRIGVAGQSAGGGLTAAVSLMARDRKGPPIAFQMPLYPMIDPRNITPSSNEITDRRVWNRESNMIAWRAYIGETKVDDVSSYAAPVLATDFSGLPPTYTCVGDLDPFRDETIEYITKLSQAGVPTEFHLYPGGFHAFEAIVPHAEISKRVENEYVEALKRGLEKVTVMAETE